MINEAHCFEQFIRSIPDHKVTSYGEHLSKLISVPKDDSNITQQLPYDLQLEKSYFTDLVVPMIEHKASTSVMMSPSKVDQPLVEPLQNIQTTITSFIEQLNGWINKKEDIIFHRAGDGDIKCISWHPQQRILAVCNRNDIVLLYWLPATGQLSPDYRPVSLWFEPQSNVINMKWKPHYPLTLAVSCQNSIVLWEIDVNDFKYVSNNNNNNNNKSILNSMTNATVLGYSNFVPTTLSWSSSGLLLASGSRNLNSIVVWDVASRVPTLVPRYGGNAVVEFSPQDDLLVSSSTDNTRIFQTSKWDYNNKQWSLSSSLISTSFTPFGDYLAVSSNDQIHFIQCKNKALETNGELVHVEKTTTYKVFQNGLEYHVGGHIRQIAMSSDGSRMAVIFLKNRSDTDNDRLIAIYRVKTHPSLIITPRGFLRKHDQPLHSIEFVPGFTKGALLSAVYVDGTISYFPLLYSSKSNQ